MTKASDLLVAALENEGVEYIFAIPGEENLDVLFSADTNDNHIMQKRQGAGWEAFKQRCEFIVVP